MYKWTKILKLIFTCHKTAQIFKSAVKIVPSRTLHENNIWHVVPCLMPSPPLPFRTPPTPLWECWVLLRLGRSRCPLPVGGGGLSGPVPRASWETLLTNQTRNMIVKSCSSLDVTLSMSPFLNYFFLFAVNVIVFFQPSSQLVLMRPLLTKLSKRWHSHPDDCWPSGLEVAHGSALWPVCHVIFNHSSSLRPACLHTNKIFQSNMNAQRNYGLGQVWLFGSEPKCACNLGWFSHQTTANLVISQVLCFSPF